MRRIVANIITIASILLLPWWCVVLAIIVFSFFFDFLEGIVYGFFLDAIYGLPGSMLSSDGFLIGSVILYFIASVIRPHFRVS
ncbi:MAG TPA: hypothetical protein VJH63_03135 [Candidatus Paceibacterota bacterium]